MVLYAIRHGRVSASRHAATRVRCAALAGELRLGRRRPRLQRRVHAHSWRAVGHVVAAANGHAGASGQRPAGSGQRAHQLRRGARRRRRHQPPTREPPVCAAHRAAAALTEAAISPRCLRELLLLPPLRVHLVGAHGSGSGSKGQGQGAGSKGQGQGSGSTGQGQGSGSYGSRVKGQGSCSG